MSDDKKHLFIFKFFQYGIFEETMLKFLFLFFSPLRLLKKIKFFLVIIYFQGTLYLGQLMLNLNFS